MKIEQVDDLVEPLGWERDSCHDGDCFPELNKSIKGHEGSYKKFNMTEHGEDGYISYESLNEIIEEAGKPKLKIPESIAKELDEKGYIETGGVYPRTWEHEESVRGTMEGLRRMQIARLYLASKPFDLNLVEVVPDED